MTEPKKTIKFDKNLRSGVWGKKYIEYNLQTIYTHDYKPNDTYVCKFFIFYSSLIYYIFFPPMFPFKKEAYSCHRHEKSYKMYAIQIWEFKNWHIFGPINTKFVRFNTENSWKLQISWKKCILSM